MRFSFKKALAAVLTVVFVLSAFVSTLAITSFAAEQVGTLTVANTTVDFPCNGEGKEFTVDAVVTLNSTKTYVEFAYEVTNIPTGVSLTSATVNEVEYLRPDGIVHVSIGGETTTFTIVMKFTATGTFDAFAPAINFFYADFDEVDSTLDTNVGSISAVVAGHTPAEAVKENEVPATCGAAGSYDSVVYCSICNDEISRETVTGDPATGEHIDANPADGICDVCQTPVEAPEPEHVHAYTYQYDTKQHWQVCSNEDGLCDALQTEKVAHEFDPDTGLCACGLKLDPALTIFRASPSFSESSLDYNFRFAVSGVLDLYDDVAFAITPNKYDTATMNVIEKPTTYLIHENQYTAAGSRYKQYTYSDMFLYELSLDIEFMFQAYDANGKLVAISTVDSVNPVADLKDTVTTAASDSSKKAYTDLLVVCDEFMKVTGASYPDSDLANAPSILEGFDDSAKTTSVTSWETTETFIPYNDNFGLQETGKNYNNEVRVSVQTEKVPFFNIRIMDRNNPLDASKLAVTVTYTSKDSAGEHPKEYVYQGSDFKEASAYIELKFDNVGLHDSDKVIKFSATYDGQLIFEYYRSVESYTGANQSSGTSADAMKALLHFGQSFRTYMGL